jgi:hypothetical protein
MRVGSCRHSELSRSERRQETSLLQMSDETPEAPECGFLRVPSMIDSLEVEVLYPA